MRCNNSKIYFPYKIEFRSPPLNNLNEEEKEENNEKAALYPDYARAKEGEIQVEEKTETFCQNTINYIQREINKKKKKIYKGKKR